MDWDTELCNNVNSSKTDLWIKCNSNQNPSKFFESISWFQNLCRNVKEQIQWNIGFLKQVSHNVWDGTQNYVIYEEIRKCNTFSREKTTNRGQHWCDPDIRISRQEFLNIYFTMLKDIKEIMFVTSKKTENLNGKIETTKRRQTEILELKNTMSEIKNSLGRPYSRMEMTE